MKFILAAGLLFFISFTAAAGTETRTHNCTLANYKGTSSAPCTCPSPVTVGTPFCPRLEGIKMPCVSKVKLGSCTYTVEVADPPQCLEMGTCTSTYSRCKAYTVVPNGCTGTRGGGCKTYETYTYQSCQRGACNSYNERNECTGYSEVCTTETGQRCTEYNPDETYTYDCSQCTGGYEDVVQEYQCCKKWGP